jgi:hypothetical protein
VARILHNLNIGLYKYFYIILQFFRERSVVYWLICGDRDLNCWSSENIKFWSLLLSRNIYILFSLDNLRTEIKYIYPLTSQTTFLEQYFRARNHAIIYNSNQLLNECNKTTIYFTFKTCMVRRTLPLFRGFITELRVYIRTSIIETRM